VAEFLREQLRRKSLVYHAGLMLDERRRAQEAFMNGRDLIVVATNAFGMGVDKPDIRFVIHYNIPGTVEAYYQEAGRAGRDGAESLCLMLYAPGDRFIQEFFIESEYPSREVIGSIYDFLAHQPEDPIEMTQDQIKERLRLEISEMGVGQTLKLLESAGVLERLRPRENMAIVRIDSDVSLVGLLPQNATNQRRVLSALERLVAGTKGDETYFSPHQLAQRLELEPSQFSRAMHDLCEKLPVVDYVPPFRGNAVRMLDRERKLNTLGIDFDQLEDRKKREFDKLDQMIAYAQSRQCRRRAILTYFGDRSPVECGHCDNCGPGGLAPRAEVPASDRVREIVRKILSGIARATRGRVGFGKRIVAAMLVGRNIKAIKRWRMDKLTTFGLLEEFDEDEVVLLIESLIATGWVEQEEFERFKPVIRLSAAGREVMIGERDASCSWRVPAQLLAKLQGSSTESAPRSRKNQTAEAVTLDESIVQPDRPLDRELLKKLKSARDRWAIAANLPAYMVLSNTALEGLARAKPDSIDRLLAIKGIGPAKIAKYGERILKLIAGGDAVPGLAQPTSPAAFTNDQPRASRSKPDEKIARTPAAPPRLQDADDRTRTDKGKPPAAAAVACDGKRDAVSNPRVLLDSNRPPAQELPGRATHYWTWRLLERGFTQSECALIRDLEEETVLRHALQAAREGHFVPLDAFLTSDLVEMLQQLVHQHATQEISKISVPLPDGIAAEHVELYVLNQRVESKQ
jgi:ATP-dependent DNA helicase RecQ